jgi:hypothetical protein
VTPEERAALHELARTFDRDPRPKKETWKPYRERDDAKRWKVRPGDAYNAATAWPDLLAEWELLATYGGVEYWKRPGKEDPKHSATLGYCTTKEGAPLLHVFSTDAPVPEGTYDQFKYYAFVEHDGDLKAAAAALFGRGFGEKAAAGEQPDAPKCKERLTHGDLLMRIAGEAELFQDDAGTAYAAIRVEGHVEVHAIYSRAFRRYLRCRFETEQKDGRPSADALQSVLDQLDSRASLRPVEKVFLRVGEADGKIYIDRGDPTWQAIEIDRDGWRIVDSHPVRFIRHPGMKALPVPISGGQLDQLQKFVNVTAAEFPLLVGWLAAALLPRGPFPILTLIAEKGAGKSTLAEICKRLVDPQKVMRSSPPKQPHDLALAASSRWVLNYENLVHLPDWLAAMICTCSTGGGFDPRKYYTDDEQRLFEYQRPVILNGIADFVVDHTDLMDRCVYLHLPPISPEMRRLEKVLWSDFEAGLAALFGAVLDAVVGGLRKEAETAGLVAPRMADFALFGEAVWRGLGKPHNEFLNAYNENRKDAIAGVLEDSPVAVAVTKFMEDKRKWEGTATDLLNALDGIVTEKTRQSKRWPKRPNALSGALRKFASALREIGIHIDEGPRANKKAPRQIVIKRIDTEETGTAYKDNGKASSTSSTSPPPWFSSDERVDDGVDDAQGGIVHSPSRVDDVDDPTCRVDDPIWEDRPPRKSNGSTSYDEKTGRVDDVDDEGPVSGVATSAEKKSTSESDREVFEL